jgi:hypothetical protein
MAGSLRPAETAEGVKHAADPRASLPGGFSSVPPPAAGLHCLIKNGNTVFHCPDDLPDMTAGIPRMQQKEDSTPMAPPTNAISSITIFIFLSFLF